MIAQEKRKRFKELLLQSGCTAIPGAYDALSAKIIEKAGFDAVYVGSYATAASQFALPDVMSVTLTEMAYHVENVANCLDIPLLTDAENGFSHAANIWRTVREFENAGASAIHIEDHEFGKHTGLPPVILDADKMCDKIKAALDARTDDNFLILARTDAAYIVNTNEAVDRLNAYLEAGADAAYIIFFEQVSKELRDRIKGPLVVMAAPDSTLQRETDAGINASINFPILLSAAFHAMKEAIGQFKETKNYRTPEKYAFSEKAINPYIGFDDFLDRVKRYL
jgi:methylisocitrate lyase